MKKGWGVPNLFHLERKSSHICHKAPTWNLWWSSRLKPFCFPCSEVQKRRSRIRTCPDPPPEPRVRSIRGLHRPVPGARCPGKGAHFKMKTGGKSLKQSIGLPLCCQFRCVSLQKPSCPNCHLSHSRGRVIPALTASHCY